MASKREALLADEVRELRMELGLMRAKTRRSTKMATAARSEWAYRYAVILTERLGLRPGVRRENVNLSEVARLLTEKGFRTPNGRDEWSHTQVRRMLERSGIFDGNPSRPAKTMWLREDEVELQKVEALRQRGEAAQVDPDLMRRYRQKEAFLKLLRRNLEGPPGR